MISGPDGAGTGGSPLCKATMTSNEHCNELHVSKSVVVDLLQQSQWVYSKSSYVIRLEMNEKQNPAYHLMR